MINENQFSVLAIPDTLTFYLNDVEGCKQEIKIYNMHDFDLKFKVLCTSVNNYNVNPPYGSIRKGCMINVTIELKNHDFDRKSDVFKIDAHSKKNDKIVGEKEITARILHEKPDDSESFQKSELKAAKSDENVNSSYKQISKLSTAITLDNPQNLVIISTGRFCFYVVLIFLVGMITGMILNAPQELKLD